MEVGRVLCFGSGFASSCGLTLLQLCLRFFQLLVEFSRMCAS